MALGHVMIDGYLYEITRIRLSGGLFLITAVHPGPVRPCSGAMATVFGADGQGVCQSWNVDITPEMLRSRFGVPPATVTVELPIRISRLEAEPGDTMDRHPEAS